MSKVVGRRLTKTSGLAFKVTDELRKQVEALAGYGLTQPQIGSIIGCDKQTVAKWFEAELESGKAKAIAKLAQHVYARAYKNDVLAMFVLKTQAQWRETNRTELTGADGEKFQIAVNVVTKEIKKSGKI